TLRQQAPESPSSDRGREDRSAARFPHRTAPACRASAGLLVASVRAGWLLGAPRGRPRRGAACGRSSVARFHALAQRVHEIDDVRGRALLRPFDLLAFLFAPQQVFERVLVLVLELLRL